MSHNHATEGGPGEFDRTATASELRLHLDNSHDARTTGWDYDRLVELHRQSHAAALIGEKLAEAPAAVVESIVGDQPLYLTDAGGTVYLLEPAGAWDHPDYEVRTEVYYEDETRPEGAIPLYRLTVQAPAPESEKVVDLMESLEKSLAAARATVARGDA